MLLVPIILTADLKASKTLHTVQHPLEKTPDAVCGLRGSASSFTAVRADSVPARTAVSGSDYGRSSQGSQEISRERTFLYERTIGFLDYGNAQSMCRSYQKMDRLSSDQTEGEEGLGYTIECIEIWL